MFNNIHKLKSRVKELERQIESQIVINAEQIEKNKIQLDINNSMKKAIENLSSTLISQEALISSLLKIESN